MPERRFHDSGLFDELVVMDIAEGLLAKQRALAGAEGMSNVRYVRADLNDFILDENSYDLIFAIGTVHHVEKLEHFFSQVRKALRPEGLFAMREYVGPDRIQLTDGQLGLANALLAQLPCEYRKMPDRRIKQYEPRVDMPELIRIDPSESVRSSEILSVMDRYLETVQYCPTGGTLLHPLLNQIAGNFERDERGGMLLDTLIDVEKCLIHAGLLPSDYVFVVAKKR